MIVEILLQNFKRFRELRLRAADLTVLTGANGAGKTSVLHALLLARQMTRQPEQDHVELTGVDTLELGGADDVIHREAVDELAAIEVFDTGGQRWRWSFRAPVNVRTLNAVVVERPVDHAGALGALPPEFTYLCAERLGPRDVLGASAAEIGALGVGSRGEFVAQVLASFDRCLRLAGRGEKIHEKVCRYGGRVPIREVWRARAMTAAVRRVLGLSETLGTCASSASNETRRS